MNIFIIKNRDGKKCPNCDGGKFSHDECEDMYKCIKCDVFLYPEDIGLEEDKSCSIHNW